MRIRIADLAKDTAASEPVLKRSCSKPGLAPDVTLINMNLMYIKIARETDRQNYIPLGILSIAAFLEQEGCNVEFVDYQLFSRAPDFDAKLFIQTLGKPARLVGFSCMSNLLPFTVLCAKELKKLHPDCQIVLGGVGPSPVAAEIIAAFPFIDSVVTGEGELPMLDFVRGKLTPLPERRPVADLDMLPLLAYHLIDFKDYDAKPSIISSRGCPYECTFCTEPHNFGGYVRTRGIAKVLAEIELIHARSQETMFLFQDDILPLDRVRFQALMDGLAGLSFPIQWKCFSRVDLTDELLMAAMAAHGCVQIRYGIESGSNKTLQRIRKGFTIEKAYDTAVKSLRHFPSVHASFIWGYPFEELPELEETLYWVEKFGDAGISVLLFEFSPLPGSSLYREFSEGLKFNENSYSSFVITGHELSKRGRYTLVESHWDIYELIIKYPRIFPGFYQYENFSRLQKSRRLENFKSGRTRIKNEYDL